MRQFLFKAGIFCAINLFLALVYLGITQSFSRERTEAHLFTIPRNQRYDAVFLGASHSRVFSATGNHSRMEKILDKKIVNLSKTAAGLMPEEVYLSYFYEQGNTTSEVVYFLDPFVLYAARWNEDAYFLEDEPIKFDFLAMALRQGLFGLRPSVVGNYLRSKFEIFWLISRRAPPATPDEEARALTNRDEEAVKKRLAVLYPEEVKASNFEKYKPALEAVIRLAQTNGTHITIVFLPTLLGDLPGTYPVKELLLELKKQQAIDFFDFSATMKEPRFYSDHDHLNTAGVEYFMRNYLKKIFSKL
ncbi:MAG: hypothetical protein A3D92_05470 [Bacteroidetes bacterium RIFCSPHIGHO2_02_FULL_44_7]|nr:MAG: hypothetical protein A3D92_05470 [Bacteroidetes bacterium RIFCSPHIGHO2_02_FULL_44_7]